MGYSSLVSKANISPNYVGRTQSIDSVSIHCCCSNMSLDSMGEIYKDVKRKSSANYGIDNEGNIAVFVDEKFASMCTSSSGVDGRSVSIMMSSMNATSPYALSDFAYSMLVDLLTDICIRNNIKELKWKNDEKYGIAASHGGPVTDQNIFIHRWFKKDIVDPGDWLIEKLPQIVQIVNAQLAILTQDRRRIIFLGDSRASKMHQSIGNDSNLWITNQTYGFSWVGNNPPSFEEDVNDKSAICILGGAKDINYIKPKDYADKINANASRWFNKGCPVYFVSITPVSRNGSGNITNKKIEEFNAEIKNSLTTGIGYIDAYSSIISNFIVPDGYNYDDNTNKEIYNTIIKTASRMQSGIGLNLNLNLNPTNFHPYIVTFDRNANVDYKVLSDIRVVGAIIEAGFRYNPDGSRTTKFDNPNIETQIQNLDKYNIPYGMYTVCRAKDIGEAKTEIEYFQYQTYRHPPKLGVWLMLNNLTSNTVLNNSLLKQYNESLVDLGFKGKMGIMCTRNDLKKIAWDTWQNEFYLYLVEHLTDLSVLDNLLDPQLFDIDGTEPTIPNIIS